MKILLFTLAFGLGLFANEKLDAAIEANIELQQAFFEYDADKVQSKAADLRKKILEIQDPEISKKLSFAVSKLTEIKSSNTRDQNNEALHITSTALIHLMKKEKANSKYKAYFCPMVKKNWIQNTEDTKKVMNPYAPEMPHCGGPKEF